MPIVVTLLAVLSIAAFWVIRARNAANAAGDLLEAAKDVRLAARRFGFRKRANIHPVESIEDTGVAVATLSVAFLELDGLPSREQQHAFLTGLQSELNVSLTDAEELAILGRWLMAECGGPEPAASRVARKLYKLDAVNSFGPLMQVIKGISAAGAGAITDRQMRLLDDVKQAFRIT